MVNELICIRIEISLINGIVIRMVLQSGNVTIGRAKFFGQRSCLVMTSALVPDDRDMFREELLSAFCLKFESSIVNAINTTYRSINICIYICI